MSNLIDKALAYLEAGFSVIPVGMDKRPLVDEWTTFQHERPTPEQVKSWFSSNNRLLAIIGGEVSLNTEFLDFDFKAEALKQWYTIVNEEAPGLFEKLVFENSPKGAHAGYRANTTIPGNTKLARRSIEVSGPGDHEYKEKTLRAQQIGGKWVIIPELIETRGTGGYLIVSPSKGYTLRQGDFCNMPTISADEREILIGAARACNTFFPEREVQRGYTQKQGTGSGEKLPGADFDERADVREILQRHGWTAKGFGKDGREKWARPGKEPGKESSATLTADGKVFYCFSSNAYPFEGGRGYGPFGVFTMLEHAGDFSAATKALSAQGYGTRPRQGEGAAVGRKPRFLTTKAMEAEFGKTIEWLWRDLIPKGQPVLFGGREGTGKSTDLAQISKEIVLSNPRYWVLWVATEGFVSDHSDKWHKLRIPERVVMLSDDKAVYKLQLDNYRDRDFLDNSIGELKKQTGGEVVAVVIDSIRGMQNMGENDPKIASVMSAINSVICDKHKAAAVYIAHHKKGREEIRLNKVAGGTGITSSVRAVYAVEKVSEYVCKIIPDKSNALGHTPKTYRSVLIQGEDGYEIAITEDVVQDDGTTRNKAEKFLISLFREKPEWESKEIYNRGAMEGLSSDILKKANKSLPIRIIHESVGAPWIWRCDLYNENLSLLGKTPKTEDKKPNEISKGDNRDKNSGVAENTIPLVSDSENDGNGKNPMKSARETTETTGTVKSNHHSCNTSNVNNELDENNQNILEVEI